MGIITLIVAFIMAGLSAIVIGTASTLLYFGGAAIATVAWEWVSNDHS